jgi:hypothetical protein
VGRARFASRVGQYPSSRVRDEPPGDGELGECVVDALFQRHRLALAGTIPEVDDADATTNPSLREVVGCDQFAECVACDSRGASSSSTTSVVLTGSSEGTAASAVAVGGSTSAPPGPWSSCSFVPRHAAARRTISSPNRTVVIAFVAGRGKL